MRDIKGKINRTGFHYLQPDYSRPAFKVSQEYTRRIDEKLKYLYSHQCSEECRNEVIRLAQVYYAHKTPEMIEWEKNFEAHNRFTEKDVILITYGDLIHSPGEKPLETLHELSKTYLSDVFNTVHILPFFPYSSDRGFAVLNFEEVDPNLGTWEDILSLKSDFKLMFDGVFNHVSSKSRWFQEFLNQNPDYINFFTVFSTKDRLSPDQLKIIVRPRMSDILTEFSTLYGPRLVWTTFSPDQIDLNYKNPKVLLKMIEILLTYVWRGADIIRLDAVTYLWEELGTTCVHLEQSHTIIRLFRDILNAVAPHVAIITETNVPHSDNIKYFGDGYNEAQMVYNFALPPLVLYTFLTGNSEVLAGWAEGIQKVSDQATYFNFLDSHDGIGVMAVKDILTSQEIEMMALKVLEHGGYISYKDNGDGSTSPYELNITWWSAINNDDADESTGLQVQRYLASRAIALVLMGVPGVYLHGLLGSKNDAELVLEEKSTRSINRKNIRKEELLKALENRKSTTYLVTTGLIKLIRKRIREKAFHPNAGQKIIRLQEGVFTLLRTSIDKKEQILTLTNVRNEHQQLIIDLKKTGLVYTNWFDLVEKRNFQARDGVLTIKLRPYQIVWLKNS
ncbi:MAG TPA: sugar phosphorylase [Calditrichaeota bacterium]|nr:sugar phosphorylase [Calditrichota bacterium]